MAYFQAAFLPILGGPSISMTIDYTITVILFISIVFFIYSFLIYGSGRNKGYFLGFNFKTKWEF